MSEVYYLFLSGPITGISYGDSIDWRKYVAEKMKCHPEIKVISPMRGKDYLKKEKSVKASYEDIPLSSGKGITRRDRFDTKRADAVIINLFGAAKVSIGTMIEVGWSDDGVKPIILVMEKEGNIHDHPILRDAAGFIVDNLDDAIELAKKILLPGV
ncbi:MAG: hypothetical protein HYT20_03230 [Candidatus Nealsonbacteria bacterium]|nr:hypothetical protein [Candidatus Nealsonbacteria bacterium]